MKSLKVKLLSPQARPLTRSFPNDAGLDIYASADTFIPVGSTVKVPTDIAVNIEPGYYGQINDRSGCAAKGLRVGGGVIDAGYNGHMCVVMHNLNNVQDKRLVEDCSVVDGIGITHKQFSTLGGYQIRAGDRIAQLVIQKIELPTVEVVEEFEPSERGGNGFNSTGR